MRPVLSSEAVVVDQTKGCECTQSGWPSSCLGWSNPVEQAPDSMTSAVWRVTRGASEHPGQARKPKSRVEVVMSWSDGSVANATVVLPGPA